MFQVRAGAIGVDQKRGDLILLGRVRNWMSAIGAAGLSTGGDIAAAGLALCREHRGDRLVSAVIYTDSHIDHFGGVLGVVDADTTVPIVAPEHFLEHAVSENVYAGGAMLRRGMFHTGIVLPVGATGTVGAGLGPSTSNGTVGLLAPTLDSTHTGQEKPSTVFGLYFKSALAPKHSRR